MLPLSSGIAIADIKKSRARQPLNIWRLVSVPNRVDSSKMRTDICSQMFLNTHTQTINEGEHRLHRVINNQWNIKNEKMLKLSYSTDANTNIWHSQPRVFSLTWGAGPSCLKLAWFGGCQSAHQWCLPCHMLHSSSRILHIWDLIYFIRREHLVSFSGLWAEYLAHSNLCMATDM